jgi:peptide/nickel transport system ATP-binding protein
MVNQEKALLSVRNLRTHFFTREGTVEAVNGVTFDLYPRQTLGLVGESGCGKTVTALSILRIVEDPGRIVEGEVLFRQGHDGDARVIDLTELDPDGEDIRKIRGGNIGLVFQEPMTALSPVHTIGNQMVEAIRLHSPMSKDEAQELAIELLQSVGIPRAEGVLDQYAQQLSGGLRQRALIAMTLGGNPELLIADEPTTALDVTTQAQILDLLRAVQEERGMAVMMITHDLGVIAEMCDEVVVMYLGIVAEQGPVDDIFHNPKHPYTKALLRSIPSLESEPRVKLPAITGSIPHPYNRPTGCPFHPRCRDFMPGTCDEGVPPLISVGERQKASCYLYGGR